MTDQRKKSLLTDPRLVTAIRTIADDVAELMWEHVKSLAKLRVSLGDSHALSAFDAIKDMDWREKYDLERELTKLSEEDDEEDVFRPICIHEAMCALSDWALAHNKARFADQKEPFSYVYFIKEEQSGHIKIGKSNYVPARLRDLQATNPNVLTLLGTIKCADSNEALRTERDLHYKYQDYRIKTPCCAKGLQKQHEWFSGEIWGQVKEEDLYDRC